MTYFMKKRVRYKFSWRCDHKEIKYLVLTCDIPLFGGQGLKHGLQAIAASFTELK